MKISRAVNTSLRVVAVLFVLAVAGVTRWRALTTLGVDYDEDDYLRAAQEYKTLVKAKDWAGFMDTNYRPEHPPLAKILFGLSILSTPDTPLLADRSTTADPNVYLPRPQLHAARTMSAVLGSLTAALLALINPLAGLFLSIHGMTIKYTSQIMLEALPALTSLVTVMAYVQWKKKSPHFNGWLAVSAIFLGLTAASKYLYCVVGVAILSDWVALFLRRCRDGDKQKFPWVILVWGGISLMAFFLADPYLWPDLIGRLKESILFHAGYSTTAAEVQSAGFPWWQPFVWFFYNIRANWGDVTTRALYLDIDELIAIAALFGFTRLWKHERVYVLWALVGMAFLLVWPTKWPQYILILIVPLSLAASELLTGAGSGLAGWWKTRKERNFAPNNRAETRRSIPWLVPGLLVFIVLTVFPLLFQVGVSMTTLSGMSLRDGLQGGLWREIWGGLTGQIQVSPDVTQQNSTQVHFIGLYAFPQVWNWLRSAGMPFFTVFWSILSVSLQTLLGVSAAFLLWNKNVRGRRGWQLFFILPWAIPEAIAALVWLNIFAPFAGWLTLAVRDLGTNIPFASLVGWETNASQIMTVLLLASLWYGFPFLMLATSAGLKMLPAEVYDAAAMDGANAWQTLRHITGPLVWPLLVPAVIIRSIFAFNQFYLFQMFFPIYQRQDMMTFSSFSYYLLYQGSEFSISAVINIVTILMLVAFVIIFNRWNKAGEGLAYA